MTQNNPMRYSCYYHFFLQFEANTFGQISLCDLDWGVQGLWAALRSVLLHRYPGMHGSQSSCFPFFWVFSCFLYGSSFFCICSLLHKMPLYIYSVYTVKTTLPRKVKMFLMINRRGYFAKTKWTNKENKWGYFYHL